MPGPTDVRVIARLCAGDLDVDEDARVQQRPLTAGGRGTASTSGVAQLLAGQLGPRKQPGQDETQKS